MAKGHARLDWRLWAITRRRAFERDRYRCTSCGAPGALEAHHVVPLIRGGARYDLGNISTLCRNCHIALHRPPEIPGVRAWGAMVREILS